MTLLEKIRDAAVDSSTNIADVLRQCVVLASRLGHEGFKVWVDGELNGYPTGTPVPTYRMLKGVESIGHFMGPMGEQFTNIPLPSGNVPEPLRKRISEVELRQGIGALNSMLSGPDEDIISRWPADLVAAVSGNFIRGRRLMAAEISIPRNAFVEIIDTVRNRVLRFVLEIEAQAPNAGEVKPGEPTLPQERIAQIFNMNIWGGTNITVGSTNVVQTVNVRTDDIEMLKGYFAQHGVEPADLEDLEAAVKADGSRSELDGYGKRVAGWVGNMMVKAAEGGWKVALGAAGSLIATGLRAYYGWP